MVAEGLTIITAVTDVHGGLDSNLLSDFIV